MLQRIGKLIAEYDDNDPFSILQEMGVKIFLLPMEGINGIYKTIHEIPMVFINNNYQRTKYVLSQRTSLVMSYCMES